jgi:hypothetical protein
MAYLIVFGSSTLFQNGLRLVTTPFPLLNGFSHDEHVLSFVELL